MKSLNYVSLYFRVFYEKTLFLLGILHEIYRQMGNCLSGFRFRGIIRVYYSELLRRIQNYSVHVTYQRAYV